MVDLVYDSTLKEYEKELMGVPGLESLINDLHGKQTKEFKLFLMEFALYGLAEFSMLSKHTLERGMQFKDLLSSMFSMPEPDEEDDDENY